MNETISKLEWCFIISELILTIPVLASIFVSLYKVLIPHWIDLFTALVL